MEIPFVVTPRKDTGLFNSKIGIWLFLASEVMLFGGFFSAYVFLRIYADYPWPERTLPVLPGLINTFVLIASSVTVVFAWAALKLRKWRQFQGFMGATIAAAVVFMVLKGIEYNVKFQHHGVRLTDYSIVEGHTAYLDDAQTLEHNRVNFEAGALTVSTARYHRPIIEDLLAQAAAQGAQIKLREPLELVLEPGAEPVVAHPAGTTLDVALLDGLRAQHLKARARNAAVRTAVLRDEWKRAKDEQPVTMARFLGEDPARARLSDEAQARAFTGWKHEMRAKRAQAVAIDPQRIKDHVLSEVPGLAFAVEPPVAFSFVPRAIKESSAQGQLRDGTVLDGRLLASPLVLHDVDAIDFQWTARRAIERGLDPEKAVESSWLLEQPQLRTAWDWHREQVAKLEQDLRNRYGVDARGEPRRVPTEAERWRIGWKDFVARAHGADRGEVKITMAEEFMGPDYDGRRADDTFPELEIPRDKVLFESKFTPAWNTYYAVYFAMTGLHGLHVVGGAVVLGYYLFFGRAMFLSNPEWLANRVEVGGLFWHFVDLVWIFLFPVLYLM